ncbi:MAG: prolipoprotein diacylglyceryl transferase [Candidatus Woesearchaeota archaeon]|jgi:phosphatidylglycerol:prolipoprotein diacylglycerol transferase
MFIHNINPVFLTLGPVQIRYYGLVYFIGFLVLYFFFKHLTKTQKIGNFDEEKLDLFMIYFMIGAMIGARVLDFIFFNIKTLFIDPLEIFKIWHGGMSIHGGIIGAILATYIFSRIYKVNFYELADNTIITLMIFLGIGRIANFINGELWGTISTNSATCIDYTHSQYINPPQGCRHPYQLYESLKNFAVAGILLIIKAKSQLKKGLLFWWGLLLYNFLRFFIDFYRDGGEARIALGLTMTQYLCIVFTIISIIAIYLISNSKSLNSSSHKLNKHNKKN